MPGPIQQIIFDRMDIPRLQKALDLAAVRQKLLADNVANAETAGYRRQDIDFRAELREAMNGRGATKMRATRPRHIGAEPATRAPRVIRGTIPDGRANDVDIDREMAAMAQNQLEYNIAAKLVSGRFKGLKTVIRGRA